MIDEKIKNLLRKADQMASVPEVTDKLVANIYRRAKQRRLRNILAPVAAAAIILIALGIWTMTEKAPQQNKRIASQDNSQQLKAATDAKFASIQKMLESQRQRHELTELETQLAAIPDPLEEVQKQAENTAFALVYYADHMRSKLNQKDLATQTYNNTIKLFGQTDSAKTARRRLSEMKPENL